MFQQELVNTMVTGQIGMMNRHTARSRMMAILIQMKSKMMYRIQNRIIQVHHSIRMIMRTMLHKMEMDREILRRTNQILLQRQDIATIIPHGIKMRAKTQIIIETVQ